MPIHALCTSPCITALSCQREAESNYSVNARIVVAMTEKRREQSDVRACVHAQFVSACSHLAAQSTQAAKKKGTL